MQFTPDVFQLPLFEASDLTIMGRTNETSQTFYSSALFKQTQVSVLTRLNCK